MCVRMDLIIITLSLYRTDQILSPKIGLKNFDDYFRDTYLNKILANSDKFTLILMSTKILGE